jgi:hypothetical protein
VEFLFFYIMRPVYRTAAANELFIRNCLNEKLDNLAHALIPSQSTVLLCQETYLHWLIQTVFLFKWNQEAGIIFRFGELC